MNRSSLFPVTVLAAALAACTSPEATRTQGGGPGADTGNRSPIVRIHAGAKPYWQTPNLIPVQPPPLQPAQQAAELSQK